MSARFETKMGKTCKISGEKCFFSPQANFVQLCFFTARVSSELTKINHISPLTTILTPYADSNLGLLRVRIEYLNAHRNCSNLRTTLGKVQIA